MKLVAAVKQDVNSSVSCLYVTFHWVVHMDSSSP